MVVNSAALATAIAGGVAGSAIIALFYSGQLRGNPAKAAAQAYR